MTKTCEKNLGREEEKASATCSALRALLTKNISNVEKRGKALRNLRYTKRRSLVVNRLASEPPFIVCSHFLKPFAALYKHCEDGIIKEAPENSKRPGKTSLMFFSATDAAAV